MKANMNIFRSYDIRGIYGKDIDEGLAARIGRAFAMRTEGAVAVGYDIRATSPSMAEAFMAGLLAEGKRVVSLGSLPLGAAAFVAWQSGLELAYVTASHLGPEWNGIKFFHPNGIGYFEPENYAVRDVFSALASEEAATVFRQKGELKEKMAEDSLQEYIAYLVSKIRPSRRLKVVIDCGNGAGCLIAPKLFENAGFEAVTIFGEPDGNFPNRGPDPVEADLSALRSKVIENSADLGIAYDGDGDRMVLMDDTGRTLAPSQTACFVLSELLQHERGPIVANVEFTSVIEGMAAKFGREVIRVPVGHTFMMEAVHRTGAAFGVETASHYSLPKMVPFDDALAVSYYAACLLSSRRERLSQAVATVPVYPFERINIPCSDERKFEVVKGLKQQLVAAYPNVNTMDGIRVDLEDGWALIRVSNTEPKIRLTVEAKTPEAFRRIKEEFSAILKAKV
jgi:phosphomannomutase